MQALNKSVTGYIIATAIVMVAGIAAIATGLTAVYAVAWLVAFVLLAYGMRLTSKVVTAGDTIGNDSTTDEKMYTSLMVNSLTAFFTGVMVLVALGASPFVAQFLAFGAPLFFWAYLGKLWLSGHLTGEKPKFPEIPQ